MKLIRLPPSHITAKDFEFVDQASWKIDSYPTGLLGNEGTKIEDIIDDKESSCYFRSKYINYDHGFIVDLGEETEFYGFKYFT